MKVVTVIPIARGLTRETLTYFSNEHVSPGTLVTIPLRNRSVSAIVTACTDAKEHKSAIRKAEYTLRKIKGVASEWIVTGTFMETAEQLARYYATTPGAILYALIPQPVFKTPLSDKPAEPIKHTPSHHFLHAPFDIRTEHYQSEIAKTKGATLILAPTTQHAKRLHKALPDETLLLHSGLSAKKMRDTWKRIHANKTPPVVVGTGSSILSIPREDITLVIVDQEYSEHYKQQTRPFVDMRTAGRIFADVAGASSILGGLILQVETWHEKLKPLTSPKYKPPLQDSVIADMTEQEDFTLLGTELSQALTEHEKIFLLAGRRGFASVTVCKDCGHTVTCSRCDSPLVLHTHASENEFRCHHCQSAYSTKRICRVCSSWNLEPYGVGIERIEQEIDAEKPVFRIDSDTTPSQTAIQETLDQWDKTGGILLGTSLALPYLTTVPIAGIVSIDSLFALPDFHIEERIFSLITHLRYIAQKNLIIQTRQPDNEVLTYSTDTSLETFYTQTLKNREKLNLPPFTTLIKLTATASSHQKAKAMLEEIDDAVSSYTTYSYPAFTPKVRNQYVHHLIIEIPASQWVDEELVAILRGANPAIAINVSPKSIL